MATRIDMPQLGLTMEKGTILQWLKAEGEKLEKGQPVVLIQTEKVEYEVEAPAAGTLLKVVAKEGAELPVGGLMGILGQQGEDVSALLAGAPAPAEPSTQRVPESREPSPVRPGGRHGWRSACSRPWRAGKDLARGEEAGTGSWH